VRGGAVEDEFLEVDGGTVDEEFVQVEGGTLEEELLDGYDGGYGEGYNGG